MPHADIFHPPLPADVGEHYYWNNLRGASIGLALSNAITESNQPILIIAPDSLAVSHLLDELHFFHDQTDSLLHFPAKIPLF